MKTASKTSKTAKNSKKLPLATGENAKREIHRNFDRGELLKLVKKVTLRNIGKDDEENFVKTKKKHPSITKQQWMDRAARVRQAFESQVAV